MNSDTCVECGDCVFPPYKRCDICTAALLSIHDGMTKTRQLLLSKGLSLARVKQRMAQMKYKQGGIKMNSDANKAVDAASKAKWLLENMKVRDDITLNHPIYNGALYHGTAHHILFLSPEELETIKRALQALTSQSEWQPIETYDKSIHPNCVMVFDRVPVPARYDSDSKRWMMGGTLLDAPDYFIAIRVHPTHWQPITPPQKDNTDGQ